MNVSVVGLGIMGAAIAKRLIVAEHAVTVTNRTREKADPLVALGARWVNTPAEAAAASEIILSMVTDPDAALTVSLGERGVAAGLQRSCVHAEMSTISPDTANDLAQEYGRRGLRFVQAPVLGSRPQIEQAKLLIIAGGETGDIDQCRPVWSAFAKQVWGVGEPEQASAMKLACNLLMGQMIVGLGQSLALVKRYGMEPRDYLDIIGQSALAAPQFQAKGDAILKGEYPPHFTVANLLKDLRLGADAARKFDIDMPLNAAVQNIFVEAVSRNYADEDYAAAVKVLAEHAGVDLATNQAN